MNRVALPARRQCDRFTIHHDGISYTVTLGEYPDGRIGEIFITAGKSGTGVQAWAYDCGVLASLAIQHGCPLATIQKALVRIDDATPAGAMGKVFDIVSRSM